MFEKILIANRGEIACRVARTARRMGLRVVAVHSDVDAGAVHVALADEACAIGPAPAVESYLNIEAVIDAARQTGAQAVHPGYGFLAENADFAEACAAAGLVFIGPPPDAIRTLGSKSAAKRLMKKAGVPLVPGYHGKNQEPAKLAQEANKLGYPLLIKASAGGGGKGMRVVEREVDFTAALEGAKREALANFSDDQVLIEAYLDCPRHIEVQVFADTQGNALHLFERDCSLQRRHQKVIEEAPAPGMTAARRAEMGAAAVAAVRASGYVGAGTVEFIVQGDAFYFMEMNTRLQVEHPVTEMITGQDLVEWQIRVAAGEAMPLTQDDLAIEGHAFEARIYAEDPARDFLPSTGRLVHLRFPVAGPRLRIETGVREGDEVTRHYDPMIAKLVVWDHDRPAALARLGVALAETEIVGPVNNVAFLACLAAHPDFGAGAVDTGFIARHRDELAPDTGSASDDVLALASLAELLHRRARAEARARRSADPYSPWQETNGWRLNAETHAQLLFRDGERDITAKVFYRLDGYFFELPDSRVAARGALGPDGALTAELDGRQIMATVVRHGGGLTLLLAGESHHLHLIDPMDSVSTQEAGVGRMTAPMPGRIIKVEVTPGETVIRGAPLMVLEAMKMEHSITAPADGIIAEVRYAVDDLVEEGAELILFESEEAAT